MALPVWVYLCRTLAPPLPHLPPATKKTAVLTKHITEQAKKDSAAMAHVLRAWMNESGDDVKHP